RHSPAIGWRWKSLYVLLMSLLPFQVRLQANTGLAWRQDTVRVQGFLQGSMHLAQRLPERAGYLLHELGIGAVEAIAALGELIDQLGKTVVGTLSLFRILAVIEQVDDVVHIAPA